MISTIVSRQYEGTLPSADGAEEPLEDPLGPECCRTFVMAVAEGSVGPEPSRIRTYYSDTDQSRTRTTTDQATDWTVWQAARATSTFPSFSKSITLGNLPTSKEVGFGFYNPAKEALAEAHRIWPDRKIGCLVSIGSGIETTTKFRTGVLTALRKRFRTKLTAETLRQIDVDCKRTADEVWLSCNQKGIGYFRLSAFGDPFLGLSEYKWLNDVIAITEKYLSASESVRSTGEISRCLVEDSDRKVLEVGRPSDDTVPLESPAMMVVAPSK